MAEKKPRICEILEVEVGQVWTVGTIKATYMVDKYGYINHRANGVDMWRSDDISPAFICGIINGDYEITRKPFWTDDDRENAKMLQYILPNVYSVKRTDLGRLIALSNTQGGTAICSNLFPTLKAGNSATLSEILGSAEP